MLYNRLLSLGQSGYEYEYLQTYHASLLHGYHGENHKSYSNEVKHLSLVDIDLLAYLLQWHQPVKCGLSELNPRSNIIHEYHLETELRQVNAITLQRTEGLEDN